MAREGRFDDHELIAVFHRWIRESRLGDELLIDVADYRHVPSGPGVMLIGHDGHYSLDHEAGLGLAYARKRDPIGDAGPRLAQALRAAFTAAGALEGDPSLAGKLRFDAGQLQVQVMSRLVAPNTTATYESFRPHLAELLAAVYGGADATIQHLDDARQPFAVRVEVTGEHRFTELLARLPG